MKRLFTLLLLLPFPLFGNAAWENAAYIVLTGPASDTGREIHYLDMAGNILGKQTLATSNYATANAIVYGSGMNPSYAGNGLGLFRGVGTTASRTMNFYDDPLLSPLASGSTLPRNTTRTYADLATGTASDMFIALDIANDGRLSTLVQRDTGYSYIYNYMVDEGAISKNILARDATMGTNYWDMGGQLMRNFCYGDFLKTPQALAADQQVALLLADSRTVNIRYLYFNSAEGGYLNNMSSFNVGIDGKNILDMWESDYNYLAVLYDDNSVVEYDAQNGSVMDTYTFIAGGLSNVLDVVRVADLTIPEPAEYAALFGLFALLFAARRRRER